MGFLDDIFDRPNLLGSLVGWLEPSSANAAPAPPPPQPPPQVMAQAPQSFSGNAPDPGSSMVAPSGTQQPPPVVDATDLPPINVGAGGLGLGQPYQASNPAIEADNRAERAGYGQASAPSGTPLPPRAMMNPAHAPPTQAMSGGLAASLGLGNRSGWQAALAGLGKGLSAVGQQRPGTTGAAAFAAGMGGALTGTGEEQHKQEALKREAWRDNLLAQNQLFNQKSTAFKDWVLGQKLDNDTLMSKAHAQYFMNGGRGGGSNNAMVNTEYGRSMEIERRLLQYREQLRKDEGTRLKATGKEGTMNDVEYDQSVKRMDDKVQTERNRLEEKFGVPHDTYLQGTDKGHAFDYDKLTPQQRLQIPDGAWLKKKDPKNPKADKNGYIYAPRDYQSHPPFPGWQPQSEQQQPPSPQQTQQDNGTAQQRGLSDADFS